MSVIADLLRVPVQFLLEALYPIRCAQCDQEKNGGEHGVGKAGFFCATCWDGRKRIEGPRCPGCAAPYASDAALSDSPQHRCFECRDAPPLFARAITPFVYEGAVATAIHLFKYEKKTTLAAPLAGLVMEDVRGIAFDCVAAIPLHPRRLRMREFNQSLLLARQVARTLSLPLSMDALSRVRETPPQVGLSKKERNENVRNAFQVGRSEEIKNKRILLIDDVYTTGATLKEGAKALMRAGAAEVTVATVARTVWG